MSLTQSLEGEVYSRQGDRMVETLVDEDISVCRRSARSALSSKKRSSGRDSLFNITVELRAIHPRTRNGVALRFDVHPAAATAAALLAGKGELKAVASAPVPYAGDVLPVEVRGDASAASSAERRGVGKKALPADMAGQPAHGSA